MAQQDQQHMFHGTGWGAVSSDLGAVPAHGGHYALRQSTDHDEDDSAPSSPAAGAAPPPDLVAAFLHAHRSSAAGGAEAINSGSSSGKLPAPVLRSSSINSDADGEALLLPNPFAVNSSSGSSGTAAHTHYPQLPHFQQQQGPGVKAAAAPQQQQQLVQKQRKQRSLLQRLLRGLMITGASAGLVALGAWGGSLAYRHYMAQLDDRDQLARRVADLQKTEEKLVLRCTALEQDRQTLTSQLSEASSALAAGAAARTKLQQQLAAANAEREDTVKLNLNLQRKLTSLEEQHTALSATHQAKLQALDATLSEAARLDREVHKLTGSLEKLESRCGALESANVELKRENAALAAAQHKVKTQKC